MTPVFICTQNKEHYFSSIQNISWRTSICTLIWWVYKYHLCISIRFQSLSQKSIWFASQCYHSPSLLTHSPHELIFLASSLHVLQDSTLSSSVLWVFMCLLSWTWLPSSECLSVSFAIPVIFSKSDVLLLSIQWTGQRQQRQAEEILSYMQV